MSKKKNQKGGRIETVPEHLRKFVESIVIREDLDDPKERARRALEKKRKQKESLLENSLPLLTEYLSTILGVGVRYSNHQANHKVLGLLFFLLQNESSMHIMLPVSIAYYTMVQIDNFLS